MFIGSFFVNEECNSRAALSSKPLNSQSVWPDLTGDFSQENPPRPLPMRAPFDFWVISTKWLIYTQYLPFIGFRRRASNFLIASLWFRVRKPDSALTTPYSPKDNDPEIPETSVGLSRKSLLRNIFFFFIWRPARIELAFPGPQPGVVPLNYDRLL